MRKVEIGKLRIKVGHSYTSWMVGITVSLSRDECCLRVDALFYGFYLGLIDLY